MLFWSGISSVALVLLLATAGWWLWTYRVEYINRFLISVGPARGSVTDFTLTNEGATLHGFELRDVKTDAVVLRLPELVLTSGMRELLARRVRSVSLNDAKVIISEPFLEQVLAGQGRSESSAGLILPGGWQVTRADLRNARLRYEERDGTVAELVANYHADDIATSADGTLNIGEQELTITGDSLVHGDHPVKLAELRARGRIHEGVLDLDVLTIDKLSLAMTPAFLDFLTPDSGKKSAVNSIPQTNATQRAPSFIRGVRIARVDCNHLDLSTTGFTAGNVAGIELPDASARVDYETTGFAWLPDQPFSMGAQRLRLNHLEMKPPAGEGLIACREMNLVMPAPVNGRWSIQKLTMREPEIHWTPELRRLLLPARQSAIASDAKGGDAQDSFWSAHLQYIEIRDARLRIADTELMPFELRANATLKLHNLRLDARGAHSAEAQTLDVQNLALSFPMRDAAIAGRPFFELPQGTLAIKLDEWNASKAVETFELKKPVVRLRDGNTPWFDAATAKANPDAGPADADAPLWQQIHFGQLSIEDGSLDIATAKGERVLDAQARLTVTTDKIKPGWHRVRFENFVVRLPGLTLFPFPVARVSFVEGAASLPDVWSTHRVEFLHIGGANIEASNALMKFFEQPATESVAPDAANPKSKIQNPNSTPDWIVGDFNIADSFVTLDRLVPGMDSVKFQVSLEAKDVPLSPEGFAADVAPQRIELANLLIPSPFGGAPVAKLDSVFVNFSPAGLIAKRLDKVEIVSPTLFIGEPLFWYVDYYRRFAALGAPGPEAKVAALDKIFALQAAAAAIANEPPPSQAGWDMGILQVHRGRLVIAPKGVPLSGFRTPFPFSFTSEMSNGTLQADFEIPEDNYEMPDLKLKFEGMSGKVQFNLPVRDRDNNLTQVFKVKRMHWKELHIDDAFLTVTFDQGGIYGKFGGAAYDGYVNGEFNVYLDAVYSWDGWLNGTDVQTREITRKLFPGYFFMEGQVGATLTMNGDSNEVYQTDLKFGNRTPGRISIEALNDLIKTLPESLSGLKQQLTQVSLETMRDFAYEHAEGQVRSYGREGRGTLKFTGPTGTRSFEINAYDHRWKTDSPPDKKPSTAQDDTN